ncbi:unnamed protein product [Peronospora belbahrii]|uniref:Uncharacterized protein n=1 Tax=Peronospora belbahrii TaxID=622444 RepID=A0ABN8D5A1_9STRA|nr:unnamed protein product [Peronospora belbahrii]
MTPLFHHTERRRRQNATSHDVCSPLANSEKDDDDDNDDNNNDDDDDDDDESDDDDDVQELDPIDGFPSPPMRLRPRRRFVKAGHTTYELSFSRRQVHPRQAQRGGRMQLATRKSLNNEQNDDEYKAVPAVSSLSRVLTEVMTGETKALNNIIDTTPPQPNVTYVVEHAADGTFYVAASDGNRYFANSAIGQIFIKPNEHDVAQDQRLERACMPSGKVPHRTWQPQPVPRTKQLDPVGAEKIITIVSNLPMVEDTKSAAQQFAEKDVDVKKGPKALLGSKGFQLGKKKEKKGSATDIKVQQKQDDSSNAAVIDATHVIAHKEVDDQRPMLDIENVVQRSRADSVWQVAPPMSNARQELEAPQPTEIRLLDSKGLQTANQARSDLLASLAAATNENDVSDNSSSCSSLNAGSFTSSTGSMGASIKTLPRLQPKQELPALPIAFDAYDEDDNPMCRSFQNVRNVDLIPLVSDKRLDEEEHKDSHDEEYGHDEEHGHDEEQACVAAVGDDDIPDVNSPDFAGRVRVSSGATSVAEFVGGFKGQLSRRSGASGLVNRKRAVRHARLTAEEQKAADLARKIREARNRVPLEFRDEYMSASAQNELQQKRNMRSRGRRVHFNPEVLCREFDVESEDEDDGYDSPDEIVDAVQLVSKRDVVHAEDVVAAVPMQQLELPSKKILEANVHGNEAPVLSLVGANTEGLQIMQNDPLSCSQLNNDKRMSFSDL